MLISDKANLKRRKSFRRYVMTNGSILQEDIIVGKVKTDRTSRRKCQITIISGDISTSFSEIYRYRC